MNARPRAEAHKYRELASRYDHKLTTCISDYELCRCGHQFRVHRAGMGCLTLIRSAGLLCECTDFEFPGRK